MSPDDADKTIKALADPHRRALLDALRVTDGQAVSELGAVLPELGRHAVLKHVRVLEEAELVVTRKEGRIRSVHLNPVPIVALATRWLDDYSFRAGRTLLDLQNFLQHNSTSAHPLGPQTQESTMSENVRTVVATIVINATADRVWQAITDPAQTQQWFFGGSVRSSWAVGDSIEWVNVDGAPLIVGTITAIEEAKRLAHTFRAVWSTETAADAESDYEWVLVPVGSALTRLTLTHRNIPVGSATAQQVEDGTSLILSAMKTFVETGRTMPGMG